MNGRWTKPVELKFPEYKYLINPRFSEDGRRLNFTICDNSDYRFCYTEISDSKYSDLKIFNLDYVKGENILGYTMDRDSTFYFSGKRDVFVGGNTDIYKSYKRNNKIIFENMSHLNGIWDDDSPILSPDGKYLLYNQVIYPQTDSAQSNIMICKKTGNGEWSNPYNLGRYIGAKEKNWGPFITYDKKYLFFSMNSPTGFNIYWISSKVIENLINEK